MTQYVLVPHPYWPEHAQLSDWALCQASWAKQSPNYQRAFAEYGAGGHSIILDWQHPTIAHNQNALEAEYEPLERSAILGYFRLIRALRPRVVVVPDVLRRREATIAQARAFFQLWENYATVEAGFGDPYHRPWSDGTYRPDFMFVPQGEDFADWLKCLEFYVKDDMLQYWAGVIGVPKYLESAAKARRSGRAKLVPLIKERIEDVANYHGAEPSLHFLGVWGGYDEMCCVPGVATWDTSLPIAAAQHGVDYNSGREETFTTKYELQIGPAAHNFAPLAKHDMTWSMAARNVLSVQFATTNIVAD